jgi:hypothetical protein
MTIDQPGLEVCQRRAVEQLEDRRRRHRCRRLRREGSRRDKEQGCEGGNPREYNYVWGHGKASGNGDYRRKARRKAHGAGRTVGLLEAK